jgi:putative ABC transport system substrate-binding protein
MKKKITVLTLSALLFVLCFPVDAQQPTKIPRIGCLYATSLSSARIEAFRQGLRELGYVEGKNIAIEWRSSEGKYDRLPALAAELVRLKVDIIITGGAPAPRAAKEATVTIPIVMTQVGDPVGSGFVASLARPGGNITGLSQLSPELSGKRLEILKEVLPKLSRLAVFGTSFEAGQLQVMKEIERAAAAIGVKLQRVDVLTTKDIEPHSVRQLRDGLTPSLRSYRAASAVRPEKSSQNSPLRTGFP